MGRRAVSPGNAARLGQGRIQVEGRLETPALNAMIVAVLHDVCEDTGFGAVAPRPQWLDVFISCAMPCISPRSCSLA